MWGELRPIEADRLVEVERAFIEDDGSLRGLMAEIGLHRAPQPGRALDQARALGWVDDAGKPTMVGLKVADSCREYRLWEERLRRMPHHDTIQELRVEEFGGLSVVELGSGFGCNLLSLAQSAREVVGVEIEPVYGQLGPILARVAGLSPPCIVRAGADATGLEPGRFDRVLVLGAMQYMPILETMGEVHRLLRPGGRAYLLHSHFTGFVRSLVGSLRRGERVSPREAVNLVGMLAYPYIGRAFMRPSDHVYLTHAVMRRWSRQVGLVPKEFRVVAHETFYWLERPD